MQVYRSSGQVINIKISAAEADSVMLGPTGLLARIIDYQARYGHKPSNIIVTPYMFGCLSRFYGTLVKKLLGIPVLIAPLEEGKKFHLCDPDIMEDYERIREGRI